MNDGIVINVEDSAGACRGLGEPPVGDVIITFIAGVCVGRGGGLASPPTLKCEQEQGIKLGDLPYEPCWSAACRNRRKCALPSQGHSTSEGKAGKQPSARPTSDHP